MFAEKAAEIRRLFHEKSLGAAQFFGNIEWTKAEARTLHYSPQQLREVLIEAHFMAEQRSIGNPRGAWYHLKEMCKLMEDRDAESVMELKQGRLL